MYICVCLPRHFQYVIKLTDSYAPHVVVISQDTKLRTTAIGFGALTQELTTVVSAE